MTRLSPTVVRVGDDQITIDAEALAPKLGLTVETLKDNMSNGIVMSVTETGMDEDAGRTRLTFRYRARVWRVVVEADGSLIEDPVPTIKLRPTTNPISLLDLARDAP